jgi:hypothetical protein
VGKEPTVHVRAPPRNGPMSPLIPTIKTFAAVYLEEDSSSLAKKVPERCHIR